MKILVDIADYCISGEHHITQKIIRASLLDCQVILPVLDIRVKNVARTYSLEHEGESVLFDQLFMLLNSDMQNLESCRRELASCTGALQTSISKHMSKEEEQVKFYFNLILHSCDDSIAHCRLVSETFRNISNTMHEEYRFRCKKLYRFGITIIVEI